MEIDMSYKINYIKGDLFNDYDRGKKTILVHGCNAQGVMGSGVAKTFRQMYPEAYVKYVKDVTPISISKSQQEMVGIVSYHQQSNNLILASAITQCNYGRDEKRYVSYDGINLAFLDIFERAIKQAAWQIVFPLIGAGLGGGDWRVISACINSAAMEAMLPPEIKLICFVSEDWMVSAYDK